MDYTSRPPAFAHRIHPPHSPPHFLRDAGGQHPEPGGPGHVEPAPAAFETGRGYRHFCPVGGTIVAWQEARTAISCIGFPGHLRWRRDGPPGALPKGGTPPRPTAQYAAVDDHAGVPPVPGVVGLPPRLRPDTAAFHLRTDDTAARAGRALSPARGGKDAAGAVGAEENHQTLVEAGPEMAWAGIPVRRRKERLAMESESQAAPASAPESLVQEISALWGEHLNGREVGADDDFFELGGNSLIGIKIIDRVSQEYGVELSVRDFYLAQTPARVAELIEQGRART
ncbi:hypothetical protein GCM10010252_76240 [Streptomyces aureoverticillatus]|nr:hypothetical protein GCM10010252_76240 [Streptomyces aureoverticillatus]